MDCHIHRHSMCALMCTGQQSKHFPGIHILCDITDWTPAFYVYILSHRWGKIDEMPCEFKKNMMTCNNNGLPHSPAFYVCFDAYRPAKQTHLGDKYSICQTRRHSKCMGKNFGRSSPHSTFHYVSIYIYKVEAVLTASSASTDKVNQSRITGF